jgi:flagellar hook assembly protein FlgD
MATPPEVADFYITTVDQAGQQSVPSETVIFDPFVGVNELNSQNKVAVYPNPASSQANISFDISESGNYQLAVYDLEGRQVKSLLSAELKAGHFVFSWNGANDAGSMVKNGVYFFKLTGNNKSFTSKVVLMR